MPSDGPGRTLGRRDFLRTALTAASVPALAATAEVFGAHDVAHRLATGKAPTAGITRSPTKRTTLPSGVVVPTADWVRIENARPGTLAWAITSPQPTRAIEGFAGSVSAQSGDEVALFVHTTSPSFHVEAYRMGYYGGLGARLIWQSAGITGAEQPSPSLSSPTSTVQCHWSPSLTLHIDDNWVPGAYLLKLVGSNGAQQYVPLCIRDDASTSAFLVQHSVTTWQAYNLWGGYSLYLGSPSGFTYGQVGGSKTFARRSRAVSFDRPYPVDWGQGAADFIGLELPLVYDMERLSLDVSYTTDVDTHERPELLLQHRALFSLGHDEYWSLQMREGAARARDSGTNIGFLGANACYRPIRFESSPVGPNRVQVCYKSSSEDPFSRSDPSLATPITWMSPPTSWHPSQLVGATYSDIDAVADLVISDASGWIWSGTGLADGQHLAGVVQGEYDSFDAASPGPQNIEILAHSPVANRGPGHFSDITWYTAPGGGGVLDIGFTGFVNKLSSSVLVPGGLLPAPVPGVTDVLLRAMQNVYSVLGTAPASVAHPSKANWRPLPASSVATPVPSA